jgi:hypothetical protein
VAAPSAPSLARPRSRPPGALLSFLVMGASQGSASAGCVEDPYAWEAASGPTPVVAPPLPSIEAVASSSAEEGRRVGKVFGTCHEGLAAERDPVRDAARLALACGPVTGMVALSETPIEGVVAEGAPPVSFPFSLTKDRCIRLFGAAAPGVTDLDVAIRSPRGVPLATDHATGRLVVLQPDRPVCPLEDVNATLEVSAAGGQGAFAIFVWADPDER